MSGVGYNPYRKANGQFASKDELGDVETKVVDDLRAAEVSGDAQQVADIEEYIEEKMYDTKTGSELLEKKYGLTPMSSVSWSDEEDAALEEYNNRKFETPATPEASPAPESVLNVQNMNELQNSALSLVKATEYLDSRGFDLRENHTSYLTMSLLQNDEKGFREEVQSLQEDLSFEETNFIRTSDAQEYQALVNLQNTPDSQPKELSKAEEARFEDLKKDAQELMKATTLLDDRGIDVRQFHGNEMLQPLVNKDVKSLESSVQDMRNDLATFEKSFVDKKAKQAFDRAVYKKERINKDTVRIEAKANDLKPGDVIHGEKFSEDGKWVDDNSQPIANVQRVVTWDHKRAVRVEYADNSSQLFRQSENMKILRKEAE